MSNAADQPAQQEMFTADTIWFHVFHSMYSTRDVNKMGPYGLAVYMAIKAHTNFKTGEAFPGIPLIAELSGMSESQVKRGLTTLKEMKYLTVQKMGRQNLYTLREKIVIQDSAGRPSAVATWDYLPDSVKAAVADLKNVLVTGKMGSAQIVHIENITVNVSNVNVNGNQTNIYMAGVKDPATKKRIDDMIREAARQGNIIVTDDEF